MWEAAPLPVVAAAAGPRCPRRAPRAEPARRLASYPRVKAIVDAAHPLLQHMRINLRRRQIGMPEHQLNRAQVGAALEQMCRERVPQRVRAEGRGETGALRIDLQDLPEPD